jgi:NTP pyrophosphatase (non-canonical NTP hydrolase)
LIARLVKFFEGGYDAGWLEVQPLSYVFWLAEESGKIAKEIERETKKKQSR